MKDRIDSREAWLVTIASLIIMSVALGAPYVVIVALKSVATELGGYRSIPSAAASLAMFGMAWFEPIQRRLASARRPLS